MREVWVSDGEVRLFAAEDGEGPALVFIHGGLANHEAVLRIVGPLADAYRVIMPDARGAGRSWSSEDLTFDRLADDVGLLLDCLGIERAIIGGMSSGTGQAVRFALRHPNRVRGLIAVWPVYGGRNLGYTREQAAIFSGMDAVVRRAGDEGIEALRPLYDRLPEAMRQRAWQMASGFDAGSVMATSRFIASGAQPFDSGDDLRAIRVPTLLVRGDDAQHPAGVSDVYAGSIADCRALPAAGVDIERAVREFCDAVGAR